MKGLFLTLSVLQASWTIAALRCNDYSCNNGNCFGRGKTCETPTGSCTTHVSISGPSGTFEVFSCFDMPGMQCRSFVANNSGTIAANQCCDTDMCNDGSKYPPFEDGENYCFSASCDSEGCLEGLIRYIEGGPIWAFCKADENGCETSKLVDGQIIQETTGCVSSTCFQATLLAPDSTMSLTCCKGHMCNRAENTEPESGGDVCYDYLCQSLQSSGQCLSVEEAIRQKKTSYCDKTEKGCFTSKITRERSTMITIGCVGRTPGFDPCTPASVISDKSETIVSCCNSDRCNNGTSSQDSTLDPHKDVCYDYFCQSLQSSGQCLSVEEAIRQKKTSYCDKTDKGCFTSKITRERSTMITSGCVGRTPGFDPCTPASVISDKSKTILSCCNSDRCNNGTSSQDSTLDPHKKYCHVYICRSSPSSPCASLTTAIEQHMTTVCEMKENAGCMYMKSRDSNSNTIISNCLGTADSPNMCMHYGSWDSDRIIRCCTEDRCNPEKLQSEGEPSTARALYSIDVRSQLLLFLMTMVSLLLKAA